MFILQGAVPATVGILGGRIHVGLDDAQLDFISRPETETVKVSRRDLPLALSRNLNGGTTVAGTLMVAGSCLPSSSSSLPIFVTGGIGGVHRDGEDTMDVSADLIEMGRSNTTVISAGIKSILDIGRSLEYLVC